MKKKILLLTERAFSINSVVYFALLQKDPLLLSSESLTRLCKDLVINSTASARPGQQLPLLVDDKLSNSDTQKTHPCGTPVQCGEHWQPPSDPEKSIDVVLRPNGRRSDGADQLWFNQLRVMPPHANKHDHTANPLKPPNEVKVNGNVLHV